MRISVIMPSRGRVRSLTAALLSLKKLSSFDNPHQIRYGVACDDDDPATFEYLKAWKEEGFKDLSILFGERPETLGGLDNKLASYMPADVYVVWGDDLICCTADWDLRIAEAVERIPHGVFWWKNQFGAMSCVPIITEKWRAAAGFLFTDHFPFWYDDLWLWELWQFATEQLPEFLEVHMADKPERTIRMRELGFWAKFYHGMRAHRVQEGIRIAAALGLPRPRADQVVPEVFKDYKEMHPEMVAAVEKSNKAETGPADPAYLRAKARAEDMMKAHA